MAEKNDDIKQLFTHLGLNPNDYQEIRNAARVPEVRTESVEAARRWSLLDSMASQPMAEPSVPPAAPVVIQVSTPAATPASTVPPIARELSRAEIERESLQSFFEAVKEPLPSATLDGPQDGPSIPATVEIRGSLPPVIDPSTAEEPAAARIADLVRSRWPTEAAAPAPAPAESVAAPGVAEVTRPPVPREPVAAAAPGDARLRLNYGATPKPDATAPTGESLIDVFRRLDAAGRPR